MRDSIGNEGWIAIVLYIFGQGAEFDRISPFMHNFETQEELHWRKEVFDPLLNFVG